MDNVENAVRVFKELIGKSDREELAVIAADSQMNPVLVQIVGMGDKETCIASIPEIFKAAIIANASHLFLGHNHPSGNCEPSSTDVDLTIKLRKAGKILGIDVTDHIIVCDGDEYYSFMEHARQWDKANNHMEEAA
jgi:DNA repair protein RadC